MVSGAFSFWHGQGHRVEDPPLVVLFRVKRPARCWRDTENQPPDFSSVVAAIQAGLVVGQMTDKLAVLTIRSVSQAILDPRHRPGLPRRSAD
jgi:hypothetical protein